jgi:hypothetical protein
MDANYQIKSIQQQDSREEQSAEVKNFLLFCFCEALCMLSSCCGLWRLTLMLIQSRVSI